MKEKIEWIAHIANNEEQAIHDIYSNFQKPFVAWVISQSKCSEVQAYDMFQNAVYILYNNIYSNKIQSLENMRSYLFSIGRNKLLERYREKKKMPLDSIDNFDLADLNKADDTEEEKHKKLKQVYNALDILGDPCKTLIISFYLRNLSLDEIAVEMNYKNRDTAKTKKFKCMQRLRKILFNL